MERNRKKGPGKHGAHRHGPKDGMKAKGASREAKRYEGVISVNSRGVGYVPVQGFEQDVEIETHFLKTALDGDTVEIVLHPKAKNMRQQGEVVKIVSRAKMEFVGTIDREGGSCFLVPDDKKVYVDILIPPQDAKKLRPGDKVLARIVDWKGQRFNPEGKVLKALGRKGDHETEMQSIILERGIVQDFQPDVAAEAEALRKAWHKIPESEIAKRRDFRAIPTFTIDPVDAKDFDDALSFRRLGGGKHEIGVHIADVSHFVREGTALDKEARRRGFSVYLVDRTIPMLPEALSNDLASLNPEEEKLAFSSVFVIDDKGLVTERWFGKTVIRSAKRFSYEEAQGVLDTGDGEHFDALSVLNRLAKRFRDARFKKGAIDFDTDEVKFKLDPNGKPIEVVRKVRLDTHKLIEEFMLLANREVAEHVLRLDKEAKKARPGENPKRPFIYRIHDLPNPDKLSDLGLFIKALGYTLGKPGKDITPFDISKLLADVEGASQESLIKTAAIRSMAKAIYSTQNIGHFGLAFRYYTHFTSPIRRYPDLVVHRLLHKYLEKPHGFYDDFAKYERIAMDTSEKEVKAADAERASIKYKQVEFLKDKVGQTFDGIISGITEWGIYVEDSATRAEGMVKIRDIGDDFFVLDTKTYSLVGERTKKRYSLGDKVKVKLTNADLDKKTLDFVFV